MPDTKLPALPTVNSAADDDLIYMVDVSDNTDDPTGTSTGIEVSDLITSARKIVRVAGAGGVAHGGGAWLTSAIRNSVGKYTLTFTYAAPTGAAQMFLSSIEFTTTSPPMALVIESVTTTTIVVLIRRTDTSAATDADFTIERIL